VNGAEAFLEEMMVENLLQFKKKQGLHVERIFHLPSTMKKNPC
jgi:hypothetical protein